MLIEQMSSSEEERGAGASLGQILDAHTAEGALVRLEGERLRCVACGHRCLIGPGRRGICRVRFNQDGKLRVPFGYVAGVQSDPVEKKPFNHVYPGHDALTFGMLGCDFHCSYCQNWVTSQALRDPAAKVSMQPATARQLASTGVRLGSRLVVSSYNEPLITAEWAVAVFQEARSAGLACAFVSNGNATPEALDYLQPWICAYKVDLKCFDDKRYRQLGGTLAAVTHAIEMLHERNIWTEIVTLLIPGFNDGEAELRSLTGFLASVNRDIPWHVTAFHPDYKMGDVPSTVADQLIRAAEIGAEAGLRFVYAGNAAGRVGRWENTYCPDCGRTLIERFGYLLRQVNLVNGSCPGCGKVLPGIGLEEAKVSDQNVFGRWPRAVRL